MGVSPKCFLIQSQTHHFLQPWKVVRINVDPSQLAALKALQDNFIKAGGHGSLMKGTTSFSFHHSTHKTQAVTSGCPHTGHKRSSLVGLLGSCHQVYKHYGLILPKWIFLYLDKNGHGGGGWGGTESTCYSKAMENTGMDPEQSEPPCFKVVQGLPTHTLRVRAFHPPIHSNLCPDTGSQGLCWRQRSTPRSGPSAQDGNGGIWILGPTSRSWP